VHKEKKCSSSKSAGEETNILQELMINQEDDDQQVREALKLHCIPAMFSPEVGGRLACINPSE
jgi:hypothetical protein